MRFSSHEDIFIREVLIHGNLKRACREAFPYMLAPFIPEAIKYMMDNPEIVQRINAGFIYMYREVLPEGEVPDLPPISIEQKRAFLQKIISGERRKPKYIRNEVGLAMVMVPYSIEEVDDAIAMDRELQEMQNADKDFRLVA